MQNFNFHAYTEILFGEGQMEKLPAKLAAFGKRILLVYGGGSIKRNGIYERLTGLLTDFVVTELAGVAPNPKIETVREGVRLCRENQIDAVLAVGGGSTIDCAKVIAGASFYDGDAWDLVVDSRKIKKVLPIVTVLTLAATGSEMNKNAVISNMSVNQKLGTSSMQFIPQVSVLDPTYTYGVSKLQTASGTADIMSHVMENYFKSEPDTYLQDRISEGILDTCIQYCPKALKNPQDYAARANLMWAGTLALNGLCGCGKGEAWSCHPIEHELSAFYDITHGVGLAIVTPRWMRHILSKDTADRFVDFAVNVWHLASREEARSYTAAEKITLGGKAIRRLEMFFADCGLPSTLAEVGVDRSHLREMAEAAVLHGGLKRAYVPLSPEDVERILMNCFEPQKQ